MDAPRLVIFDVDGTLVDSQDQIHAAMAAAFRAHDLPLPPRERILSIVGLSLPEAIAQLAPDAPAGLRRNVVAAYRTSFGPLRAKTHAPLFPGAREALNALKARDGILLGIATGKSRRGLDHIIAAHGLDGLFVTRQVADDHPSKPHPSMILACLAETGVPADRAVMIGDTSFDVEMALAAGVAVIGVGWGYHPVAALRAAGAGQVVDSFGDLSRALESIWGGA